MTDSQKNSTSTTHLALEERLAAIGVMTATDRLATEQIAAVDIEESLADVIVSFADPGNDLRWLGSVLAWVEAHGSAGIVEKLTKIFKRRIKHARNVEFPNLLAAYAVTHGHKRWRSLLPMAPQVPRYSGHPDLGTSLVKIRDEEAWAKGVNSLIPKGGLIPPQKMGPTKMVSSTTPNGEPTSSTPLSGERGPRQKRARSAELGKNHITEFLGSWKQLE